MRRFTPGEIEQIKVLAARGATGPSIAASLNVPAERIRKKCVELGVRLRRRHNTDNQVRAKLDAAAFQMLCEYATAHNETVASVVRLVLQAVIYDGLFAAVLDTETAKPSKPPRHGWPAGKPRTAVPVPPPAPAPLPAPGTVEPPARTVSFVVAFQPMLEGRV